MTSLTSYLAVVGPWPQLHVHVYLTSTTNLAPVCSGFDYGVSLYIAYNYTFLIGIFVHQVLETWCPTRLQRTASCLSSTISPPPPSQTFWVHSLTQTSSRWPTMEMCLSTSTSPICSLNSRTWWPRKNRRIWTKEKWVISLVFIQYVYCMASVYLLYCCIAGQSVNWRSIGLCELSVREEDDTSLQCSCELSTLFSLVLYWYPPRVAWP